MMRITDLKTTILACPFDTPVLWPYGVWEGVSVVLVELHTDEGLVGYGESGIYQPPGEATKAVLDGTRNLLIGEDPFDNERIWIKLRQFGGWSYAPRFGYRALAGLDGALWDLMGKSAGLPVYKLLGGAVRRQIGFMRFITSTAPDEMAAQARAAVDAGHKTLYFKYTTIESLADGLAAVRDEVGNEPRLRIDFNQTLSPGAAVRTIKMLDRYNLEFVEQPVSGSDLEGMAHVRRSVSVPIAADEATHTLEGVYQVVQRGAADIIGVDPRGLGSLWDAKRAAGIAGAAGLPVVARAATEMGLGQALFLHFIAATPNMVYDNQTAYHLVMNSDYLPQDSLHFVEGQMVVPDGAGLGVEPDSERVALYHEHYQKHGAYTNFGVSDAMANKVKIKPLPFY